MRTKDDILKDLRDFIWRESAWLTPDDQRAIERRIDDLDQFINERYQRHGRQAGM